MNDTVLLLAHVLHNWFKSLLRDPLSRLTYSWILANVGLALSMGHFQFSVLSSLCKPQEEWEVRLMSEVTHPLHCLHLCCHPVGLCLQIPRHHRLHSHCCWTLLTVSLLMQQPWRDSVPWASLLSSSTATVLLSGQVVCRASSPSSHS